MASKGESIRAHLLLLDLLSELVRHMQDTMQNLGEPIQDKTPKRKAPAFTLHDRRAQTWELLLKDSKQCTWLKTSLRKSHRAMLHTSPYAFVRIDAVTLLTCLLEGAELAVVLDKTKGHYDIISYY